MTSTRAKLKGVGIAAVGAGIPTGRVGVADIAAAWDQSGGGGQLAVCGTDEDSLTLAWRAGIAALDAAGTAPGDVDGLWWGTARPPMAEGPSLPYLAAALGLDGGIAGLLASGSTHSGADALSAACDALGAGASTALVIASDALVPGPGTMAERSTGAGAVAFIVKRGAKAAPIIAVSRTMRPLLDRYRGSDQSGTGDPYDARLYRERELIPSVSAAVSGLDGIPESARWSLPDPDGRLGPVVARALGASDVVSAGVHRSIGDTGCAAAFAGALGALATPCRLVVVAEGGGRSSAWLVEVAEPVPGAVAALAEADGSARGTRALSYASLLRARQQLVPQSVPVAMGVPPGSAAFVRSSGELLSLLGRRCAACGAVAVPPSIHPVCPSCGKAGGSEITLQRTGTVHTFVVNHTMPPPFEAPLPICVVDLDDGARVMLQGLPEDAASIAIGDRVSLELRRYALERGAPVYGFKVRRDKE